MPYSAPIDDPYNPSVANLDPETLPWDEVMLEAMRAHALGLRVALPATVTAVNPSENQRVDVLPSLMSRTTDSAVAVPMPAVKNVSVLMPMGANYSIKLPIAVGDHGLLVFCDRSLDAWSASDGSAPVDPQDSRQHDLTDAVFIPGMVPFAMQLTDATTDMVLTSGSGQVRLQQAGRFKVGTSSAELFDLFDQTLTQAGSLSGNVASSIGQTMAGLNAVATASLTGIVAGSATPAGVVSGTVTFASPFATAIAPAITALTNLQTAVTQLQSTLQQIQTSLQSIKGT